MRIVGKAILRPSGEYRGPHTVQSVIPPGKNAQSRSTRTRPVRGSTVRMLVATGPAR